MFHVSSQKEFGHSLLCRDLKSPLEVQDFYVALPLCQTSYLKLILDTLQPFSNFQSLNNIGTCTDFGTAMLKRAIGAPSTRNTSTTAPEPLNSGATMNAFMSATDQLCKTVMCPNVRYHRKRCIPGCMLARDNSEFAMGL